MPQLEQGTSSQNGYTVCRSLSTHRVHNHLCPTTWSDSISQFLQSSDLQKLFTKEQKEPAALRDTVVLDLDEHTKEISSSVLLEKILFFLGFLFIIPPVFQKMYSSIACGLCRMQCHYPQNYFHEDQEEEEESFSSVEIAPQPIAEEIDSANTVVESFFVAVVVFLLFSVLDFFGIVASVKRIDNPSLSRYTYDVI